MTTMSKFQRFKEGVQIAGVTVNVHQKGQVFYVCNASTTSKYGIAGSDGNDGLTPERPLASINQALKLCVANRGDKVILLPGHAETVTSAGGIALNVAGLTIIADPNANGSQRPTITLGTANTATVTITANDIVIRNVLFVANFLNIATCVDITTATDIVIDNCEFRDTSAILNFVKAIRTDSTANHADGLTISNNFYLGVGTSATTSFLQCQANINRLTVVDNCVNIQGTTATAGALILATSKALTGAQVLRNNVASNLTTTSAGAFMVAGTGGSGIVQNNNIACIALGTTDLLITTGTGLGFFNNTFQGTADASGYVLPALGT